MIEELRLLLIEGECLWTFLNDEVLGTGLPVRLEGPELSDFGVLELLLLDALNRGD